MRPAIRSVIAALVFALLAAGATSSRLFPSLSGRLVAWEPADMMTLASSQIVIAASGILPASLIAVAAGATFGIVRGFLLCAGSTMAGGFLAFLLARSILRPWSANWIDRQPGFARLDRAIASGDWKVACLIRLSPVMPFAATSYGLGLTQMTAASFLLGMTASLPAMLGYVALGALGKAGLTGDGSVQTWLSVATLMIGAAASVLLTAYLRVLLKRTDQGLGSRTAEHASRGCVDAARHL